VHLQVTKDREHQKGALDNCILDSCL